LAIQLSAALGIQISSEPRRFNYLLHLEDLSIVRDSNLFIPLQAIRLASDKRLLAAAFCESEVPAPLTTLLDSFDEVLKFIRAHPALAWCLKYPTSCGASGHMIVTENSAEPPNWPRPFILQEFIRLERPEVYRTYCAAGELFGWVARRFPEGSRSSPWVAHARGARYVNLGEPPSVATAAAHRALRAAGLLDSFGCADLLQRPSGEWVVLEVGTDGIYNHVDRELGDSAFERELQRRLADAFWKAANRLS
jgi:hypothetical protein